MIEVTIHGTITIDSQLGVETIEDLINFMNHNDNSIHEMVKELELCDDLKIIKIEETE